MGGLLWVTGKWKKTNFSPEPPFPNLSDLLTPWIGVVIYPTDHVTIKPHYGTFQK